MPLTPDVYLRLLTDRRVRKVFETIVRERQLRSKDLSEVLKTEEIEDEDASKTLDWLKRAGLIGEEEAPIADFHTYYVTAEGLSTDRQLRRMKSAPLSSGFSSSS